MKKIYKFLIVGAAVLSVVGCSVDKTAEQDIVDTLYGSKDSEIIMSVGGKNLTVGMVKEQSFRNFLMMQSQQFVQNAILLEKYPVTDEEVTKEMELLNKGNSPDKTLLYPLPKFEELRLQLSFKKAQRDGVVVTEEEIKGIYDKQYKDTGVSYESVKDIISETLYTQKGNNVMEMLEKEKLTAEIKYGSADIEKFFKNNQPQTITPPLGEDSKEKPKTE